MYVMQFCTVGNHAISPGTEGVVVREGVRYCPEHVPAEPDPTPETKPYVPTLRQQRALDFHRWRYLRGDLDGDDFSEPLTDAEIDRLAKHVLP